MSTKLLPSAGPGRDTGPATLSPAPPGSPSSFVEVPLVFSAVPCPQAPPSALPDVTLRPWGGRAALPRVALAAPSQWGWGPCSCCLCAAPGPSGGGVRCGVAVWGQRQPPFPPWTLAVSLAGLSVPQNAGVSPLHALLPTQGWLEPVPGPHSEPGQPAQTLLGTPSCGGSCSGSSPGRVGWALARDASFVQRQPFPGPVPHGCSVSTAGACTPGSALS